MSEIILISGSPSPDSSSDKVLEYVGSLLTDKGRLVEKIGVTDVPAEDLLYGRFDSESIKKVAKKIEQAQGIVISSPVYKASYPGVLKALLDILPQDGFRDKVVFPIMLGGSPNHLLAIEYALKPIIAVLKGNSTNGVYITDQQVNKELANPIIDKKIDDRIKIQLNKFEDALEEHKTSIS